MLQEKFKNEIASKMQEKFGYKNVNQIPKITKVVINAGFGRHTKEKAYIKNVVDTLTAISGQKPILTKARLSISSFKIREGMTIGACVTLRGERMYQFLDKLIGVTFPRVRDFRGIPAKNIDKQGNITIGMKEQTPFPEVKAESADSLFGLEISIPTTANTYDEGLELFRLMGFPFKK